MSDNDELKGACFDLARTAKWAQKPIDAEFLSSLAEKLEKIARGFLSEPLERDIPLMVKAIRYLNHVHAMPPMGVSDVKEYLGSPPVLASWRPL